MEHQAFATLTRHHREAAIGPRPYSPCTHPAIAHGSSLIGALRETEERGGNRIGVPGIGSRLAMQQPML